MESGELYHVYTHANGFENLFRSNENYRYFLRRYKHFIPTVADTLAYCLMPNHIHFLIRVKTQADIEKTFGKFETFQKLEARVSKQFANLFSSYAQAFNKMYKRKGSLFIPNFKKKKIADNHHFTSVIHYIHAKPVHHRFVKEIAAWPWSSFHDITENSSSTVNCEEVVTWFGNLQEFINYHRQPVTIQSEYELPT